MGGNRTDDIRVGAQAPAENYGFALVGYLLGFARSEREPREAER
jgi:hypothetical protein